MSNETHTELEKFIEEHEKVISVLWLLGVSVSSLCVLIQMGFLATLPRSRKYDQLVISQLTGARVINGLCEYLIVKELVNPQLSNFNLKLVYTLYFQTDSMMICWMFLLAKKIYSKVVLVFFENQVDLLKLSLGTWLVTLICGLVFTGVLFIYSSSFVYVNYAYGALKFVVVITNIIFFVVIIRVAFKRSKTRRDSNETRTVRSVVKTGVVAFILMFITSLEVLATDLASLLYSSEKQASIIVTICVFNSYSSLLLTALFLIFIRRRPTRLSIVSRYTKDDST